MSFDWSDYLALAEILNNTASISPVPEANFRSAISRAYYAAFCKARNFLKSSDGYNPPEDGTIHKDVMEIFMYSSDQDRSFIGLLLKDMRWKRNIVDYNDEFWDQRAKAEAVLIDAREVIQILKELENPSTR